ncbi:MAG: hypothetical protein PF795_06840, partial [Kiritimatiellae bacterium]|nr:hypothetical protein [Kiritimatiellia bacterium]
MIRILHHHLRRGGVTRVMLTAAELLRDAGEEVSICVGEEPGDPLPEGINCEVVPGLGYASSNAPTDRRELLADLSGRYREGDIWHVHNHSLGKNPVVADVVCSLAEGGHRMVLQPHDFAEDGRPDNRAGLRNSLPGFPDRLYPVGG